MTDQNFREIQLSSKQLVFLFMASVVLAVAIFLLGVSVGRGVKSATTPGAQAADTAASDTTTPITLPPPTQTTPADLAYHSELQGGQMADAAAPKGASLTAGSAAPGPGLATDVTVPPTAPPAAPKASAPGNSKAAATKPTEPAAPSTPSAAAMKAADSKTAETKTVDAKAAAAKTNAGSWLVQVGAFGSRDNADKLVARLKTKGYPASVTASGRLFHVRVGPFTDRADADRTASRLQREEGFKPAVVR